MTKANTNEVNESKVETIGQRIGVVEKAFSIKNHAGDTCKLNIKIDFTTATNDQIRAWLGADRVIAGQRPWRGLSKDELKSLDGQTFVAQNIGQKVKSREEKIQELVNVGLPRKMAEFSVDNPEAFKAAMDGIDTEV